MFDDNYEGVNEMDFAEPSTETEDLGENEVEVAEQPSETSASERDYAKDSAFATMRREKENAEKEAKQYREELASIKARQEARQNMLNELSGGRENADLEAFADSLGMELEEVIAKMESNEATARLQQENELLTQQISNIETERRLDMALAELEKLDSNLSEDEIGKILQYADSGLTVEDGYYAVKAKEINTRAIPPKEIGKINQNAPMEKDFFSEKEVDAMSEAEQRANYKTILKSMPRW